MNYLSIPHYRGTKEKYDKSKHADGIFFTTDTHEIIANDTAYNELIKEWTISNGTLTIRMTSGKTYEFNFSNASETERGLMSKEDKKKLDNHLIDTNNPHQVTKAQVGLSNVDNTSDKSKPISDLTNQALGGKIDKSQLGKPNGVAQLDDTGKVPSSQLPSYVDEVLEFQEKDSFPETGESGKIYVELTSNLTYRWSGTQYVEISPSIGLGETSSTAYAGNKGKNLADKVDNIETVQLPNKVDKVEGKQLSSNDFTNELKQTLEDLNSWNYIGILSSWNGIAKLTTDSTEADILTALTITPLRGNKINTKTELFKVLDQCAINKKFLKESSTNANVFVNHIGSCYVIYILGNKPSVLNGKLVGTSVLRSITITANSNETLAVLKNPLEINLEDINNLKQRVVDLENKVQQLINQLTIE